MRGKHRIVSRFEDKPAVSVYNAFVKALLKLLLVFLPQSLFYIGKHWDNPLADLGLWSSNGKAASTVKELSVYQGVVYLDNVLLEIAVLPSEAEYLADKAPGSEHYRDKRKPMLVLVRLAFIATGILGLTDDSTVPPTTGIISNKVGVAKMAVVYGSIFIGHQIGAFASAWLGGILVSTVLGYTALWIADLCLCVAATVASFKIRD